MKTPIGTVLALMCAAAAHAADFTIYNVLPFSPGREAQCAADCREYMAATGGDLVLYSLSLHPEGRPAMEKVERYVESYRALRRELEGSRVRLGVLVQSILGHWPRVDKDIEDWTRTVNIKGEKVRFCPDDPGFAKYIDDTFALLAKERPAFVLTDDDVRAYSHDAECFCPRHVAEFNELRGTKYTEAELRKRLSAVRQGDPDYVAFLSVQRGMMERLVKRFRAAIDSVDPSIPAGICVAWEETFLAPPLARAIAAKGQTPVMRVATGCYDDLQLAGQCPGTGKLHGTCGPDRCGRLHPPGQSAALGSSRWRIRRRRIVARNARSYDDGFRARSDLGCHRPESRQPFRSRTRTRPFSPDDELPDAETRHLQKITLRSPSRLIGLPDLRTNFKFPVPHILTFMVFAIRSVPHPG